MSVVCFHREGKLSDRKLRVKFWPQLLVLLVSAANFNLVVSHFKKVFFFSF